MTSFSGKSFRIAAIKGGSNWDLIAAIRIRRNSSGFYYGSIEYVNQSGSSVFDNTAGEFPINNTWQKLRIEYAIDSVVKVWRNDTLVRTLAGINHKADVGNIIEIGKTTSNSSITPSGTMFYDSVLYRIPGIAHLYVNAQIGSNSNSGLSPTQPFLTIQKAATIAGPGTTVHVASGVYYEKVKPVYSGLPGQFVNYIAEGTDSVIINGTGVNLGSSGLVELLYVNYIRFSGFHLKNSSASGYWVENSSNIRIENNSIRKTNDSGIKFRDCNNFYINNNIVRLACMSNGEECITVADCHDFEVYNNTVCEGVGIYPGGEGIDIKSGSYNGKIYKNHVYDLPPNYNPLVNSDGDVGIYIDAYSSTYPNHLRNIQVYSNIVSTPVGIAIGAEQGGLAENVSVYNNIIHNCYYHGIEVTNWVMPNTGYKKNIYIINNTVYKCGYLSGSYPSGNGIFIESEHNLDSNFVINNNILYKNIGYQIRVKPNAANNTTVSKNLLWGYLNVGVQDVTGLNPVLANPLFVDTANFNFHLMAGSPAIDAGSAVYAPAFDFDGNPRPQGMGFDIGAYEFMITTIVQNPDRNTFSGRVCPNPVDNYFVFTPSDPELMYRLQLIDITGRIIVETPLNSGSVRIDCRDFVRGLFFVRSIDVKNNECIFKLVKQ